MNKKIHSSLAAALERGRETCRRETVERAAFRDDDVRTSHIGDKISPQMQT